MIVEYDSWYNTPEGKDILKRPIVLDNINTHRIKATKKRILARQKRKRKQKHSKRLKLK